MVFVSNTLTNRSLLNIDNSAEFEYKNAAKEIFPKNEVQIYTWKDATLREISSLLKGLIIVDKLEYNDNLTCFEIDVLSRCNSSHKQSQLHAIILFGLSGQARIARCSSGT